MAGFWNLRRRILFAIVLLLVLTVGSTMLVLDRKMRDAAARGDYLKKHMNRYESYQVALGNSLLATAQLVARDRELAEGLLAEDRTALERLRRTLLRDLDAALPLDAFLIYDNYLHVAAGGEVAGKFQAAAKLFAEAARGTVLSAPALLPNLQVYQVAAVPVLVGEQQVGFVVLAVDLERPFNTYSLDSDSRKAKRHNLAVTVADDVVSSTVAGADREELGESLKNRRKVPEGKLEATVINFKGKTFDLHRRPFEALTVDGPGRVGNIALFRVRASYETRVAENLYPVLYVGIGGVLAAILVALLVARTITRPISTFTVAIRNVVAGEADLTRRLEVRGRDELADLATVINELFEKVNGLVWHIRDSSLRLGQSAQEISHVATRTFDGAKGQVSRIENSTSLTNELSRTIQEIAGRATQGAQIAGLGRDSVEKTDRGMTRIKDTVHVSWEKVSKLKEDVEKIGAIAELISKITEENSMLALNASIEAARAGAAGQGFAVVAQQMREQATRVEKNSREIIDNISSIQSVTRGLVESMETSKEDVDSGSQLVNVTLHHLTELSAIMQETAESVKEQAAASDDIAQMMFEVQRIGHEALEASQQTVDEGSSIRDKARELALLVGKFKVRQLPASTETEANLVPLEEKDDI